MAQEYPDTLGLSRKVLRVLIIVNIGVGVLIFVLLGASLIARAWVMKALGVHPVAEARGLVLGMRTIMIIGICAVPIAHVVLTRLVAIVETVRVSDPFVPANAARLLTIAWAVFWLEVLHLAVGIVVKAVSSEAHPLDIDWQFSVMGWLTVLLLFVLARVFNQGTKMREDLEGTV